jgi:hypothetical protein
VTHLECHDCCYCGSHDELQIASAHPAGQPQAEGDSVIYWIFAALTLVFLVVFGVQDLLHKQMVSDTIRHLGYPWYFCYLLGAGKLLAAAALTYPKTRILREWAYAGVTFELISSFASHWFVGDAWSVRVAPLIVLAIVAVARQYDPHRAGSLRKSQSTLSPEIK